MNSEHASPLSLDIDEDMKHISGSYSYSKESDTFDISYTDPPFFMDIYSKQDIEPIRLMMKKQNGEWVIGIYPEPGGSLVSATDRVSERIKEWLLNKHEINGAIIYPHPNDSY